MRFAFKTAPQHTTWADMLAVWKEADDIDIFESGWTFDHFYPIFSDSSGPCLEGWVTLSALASAVCAALMIGMVYGLARWYDVPVVKLAETISMGGRGILVAVALAVIGFCIGLIGRHTAAAMITTASTMPQ